MQVVHLEDRRGRSRGFPLGPGFLVDGVPVVLTPPRRAAEAALQTARRAESRTASGSTAVTGARATVAAASRLFVEGRHDAELVEKVWGDDLRVEGVVVELLDGVDDLAGAIATFRPGPTRRMGVLVDHLAPGHQGGRHRRRGARPARNPRLRAGARPPLRRRLAVGASRAARPHRLARHPPRPVVEARHLRVPRLAARRPRPTSPWPGSASSAGCAPTPTSSPPCWPASRSSSTSSPSRAARLRVARPRSSGSTLTRPGKRCTRPAYGNLACGPDVTLVAARAIGPHLTRTEP